ncbi:hypothetical protein M413DRAFT_444454, partial [Hebeloma cylindrosporum]
MEAKDPRKPSTDLPQEIIDIIVHEIASNSYLARQSLKTCSLVSKSFCFSCRRHLFSDLELISDTWQSRAARLVEILQHNVGLAACVRSLTLVLDVESHRTYSFLGSRTLGRQVYESKTMARTLAAKIGLYEDNLIKALNLLLQAPSLKNFTLDARRGVSDWEAETGATRSMKRAVIIASTAPLTTFRLSNLVNIEESLIAR